MLARHKHAAPPASGRWRPLKGHAASEAGPTKNVYATCFWLAVWYGTSLGTLVLNKVILSEHAVSSQALGLFQMFSTALLGAAKVALAASRDAPSLRAAKLNASEQHLDALEAQQQLAAAGDGEDRGLVGLRGTLLAMGALRGVTVLLGLVSLEHVAASFTETVKSTAPLFTVYISWLVLRQRTSLPVIASLVPVMAGLVICARTEVSFDAVGFWSAVGNNVIDCLQNVLSKKVVGRIGPIKLQFFTSLLAICFQAPLLLFREMPDLGKWLDAAARTRREGAPWADAAAAAAPRGDRGGADYWPSPATLHVAALVAVNVCSYHMQSVSAYFVVDRLAPVTVSVANTLKRALLIFLTILYFGNEVHADSYAGIVIVVFGVFAYNFARVKYPPPADDGEPPPPPAATLPSSPLPPSPRSRATSLQATSPGATRTRSGSHAHS